MRRPITKMSAGHYALVASIIRSLPDETREQVAQHFGAAFNQRSTVFNFHQWTQATKKPATQSNPEQGAAG